MRTDLKMRKGKMIAQGAHASVGVVHIYGDDPRVKEWLAGPFAKICVRVGSEEELMALYAQAQEAGVLSFLITDSGRTEFHGVPTKTCCAIGPDTIENIDKITGGLELL